MILGGDVGGTKVVLGLFDGEEDRLRVVREERFASGEHPSLIAIVREFLGDDAARVDAAAFGVAGPVLGGRVEMTNVDWTIEEEPLREALGIGRVHLLNDLEATAHALDVLGDDRVETLHDGRERNRTRALLAAGTGLGAAIVTEAGGRPVTLPTEAGHADWAPRTNTEVDLLAWLRERHGRVSVERVVSGPGIHEIYRFLRDTGREEESAGLAARLDASDDPSAEISEAALEGGPPICLEAMRLFAAAYGAAAGNLALSCLALGGVFLGGGIAPKILTLLRTGPTVESFLAKEPMRHLLDAIPLRVILEPRAALIGAARAATLELG